MKKTSIIAIGALVVAGLFLTSAVLAGQGNDLPSGKHYNLNIIGVDKDDKPVGSSMGHTMFVKLYGTTKIYMTQAEDGKFQVTDRNGLDRDGAAFNIAPGYYDVYARALGKPGGKLNISAYGDNKAIWPDDLYLGGVDLTRDKGKPQTVNINKLFYVDVEIDGKQYQNYWVFAIEELLEYYWNYNNENLKLLQVRFYENTTYELPELPA